MENIRDLDGWQVAADAVHLLDGRAVDDVEYTAERVPGLAEVTMTASLNGQTRRYRVTVTDLPG